MGTLRYTRTGDPCLPWTNFGGGNYYSFVEDSNFPDGTITAALNYCRNPDYDYKPWCQYGSTWSEWEYCDVPEC